MKKKRYIIPVSEQIHVEPICQTVTSPIKGGVEQDQESNQKSAFPIGGDEENDGGESPAKRSNPWGSWDD